MQRYFAFSPFKPKRPSLYLEAMAALSAISAEPAHRQREAGEPAGAETISRLSPKIGDAGDDGPAMSKAAWNPNTTAARDAARLIKMAEAKGYEVTNIEITNGNVRLGVRKPGRADTTVSEAEQLRQNL